MHSSNTCVFLFGGAVKRMEREEDEEEEALPLDMMDEDDLQLMKDLGQKASFLTRDLSSR
jgi:nucleolar complex protein 3